jgi:carboxypeptidase C (cathepsin A)
MNGEKRAFMNTNNRKIRIALSLIMFLFASTFLAAGEPATQTAPAEKPLDKTDFSVTQHTIYIDGKPLVYTARAGYLPIMNENGKEEAKIFFVAYEKLPSANKGNRPITFAFNGGPGAASIWLHLGAMGPKYVPFPDNGTAMPSRLQLVENDATWLDFTDLVFIDPVGTGYSRAAEGIEPKKFFEVDGDIESIGKFIQLYLTQFERWFSPIYLAGESYGTTRAAGLAGHLQDKLGIYPTGLVLISSVLDFQTIIFDENNDLPYFLVLPTMTATAWYHKKLPPDLQKDLAKTLSEVEAWSLDVYLPALAKGDALSDGERDKIANELAKYTGLSKVYLLRSDLRVSNQRFTKEFLRSENRLIGLMDSRVPGYPESALGEYSGYDPAFFITIGPLAMAMNGYVRGELGYKSDLPYEYLSRKAGNAWDLGYEGRGYLNVAPTLQEAMTKNTHLRVFIAGGYYDLTTPFYTNIYMANHLGLAKELRSHILFKHYPSGHQMYTDPAVRKNLQKDAETFFEGK